MAIGACDWKHRLAVLAKRCFRSRVSAVEARLDDFIWRVGRNLQLELGYRRLGQPVNWCRKTRAYLSPSGA